MSYNNKRACIPPRLKTHFMCNWPRLLLLAPHGWKANTHAEKFNRKKTTADVTFIMVRDFEWIWLHDCKNEIVVLSRLLNLSSLRRCGIVMSWRMVKELCQSDDCVMCHPKVPATLVSQCQSATACVSASRPATDLQPAQRSKYFPLSLPVCRLRRKKLFLVVLLVFCGTCIFHKRYIPFFVRTLL